MHPAAAPFLADAPGAHAPTVRPGGTLAAPAWPIAILGVPFDHCTLDEAVRRIDQAIAARTPHRVLTAGIDALVHAPRDAELRRSLLEADVVLGGSRALTWAARALGNALPERINRAELTRRLFALAAEKRYRVFLLGVSTEAEAKLKWQYPSLQFVGAAVAPRLASSADDIVRRIHAANPELLLVALGSPLQEKWIAAHYRELGVPVVVGVGPVFGESADVAQRVRGWMRRVDTLLYFLPMLGEEWGRLALVHGAPARPKELSFSLAHWCSVDAGAKLTHRALDADAAFWRALPMRAAHTLVDLSKVRRVDGTGVAFLVRWRKQLLAHGRQLVLLAPSRLLRRALAAMQLVDHFVIANDVAQASRHAETLVAHTAAQRDGTTRSLAWCGEIIAANSDDVWRMTTDHIAAFVANHATLVIIDLARLRFIDSAGAALMVRLKKWTQTQRVEIFFAHPQPNVRNVLQLTRVDQLLLEGGQ